MNYIVSVLIIVFLGIMIFTNVKGLIEKIKQRKEHKENDNSNVIINDNKEVDK